MKILSVAEMIALEQHAIAEGTSADQLMETAGCGAAAEIAARYEREHEALILVGKGNNGGDGLVVARELARMQWKVRVFLTHTPEELGALPGAKLALCRRDAADVKISGPEDPVPWLGGKGVVVDALLGTGTRGGLRGTLRDLVTELNSRRRVSRFDVVALDCPSGLSEEIQGKAELDDSVIADVTLAIGYPKSFLTRESAAVRVGRLTVIPLFPFEPFERGDAELLVGAELSGLLPRRSNLSHKNEFGRLLITGGSPGLVGAALLACRGAQKVGAGLIRLLVPPEIHLIAATRAPAEIMVHEWESDSSRKTALEGATAVAAGPGFGTDHVSEGRLEALLSGLQVPAVLDAGALTLLSRHADWVRNAGSPLVLTPHPGEMKRLLGREFSMDDRETVAREFTAANPVVLVLKGVRTLVAKDGSLLAINGSGNPGLARGGSGDVLTGMIGGLLARGLPPWDAARLGVWLHGRAAELASEGNSVESIQPFEIAEMTGHAINLMRKERERWDAAGPG